MARENASNICIYMKHIVCTKIVLMETELSVHCFPIFQGLLINFVCRIVNIPTKKMVIQKLTFY